MKEEAQEDVFSDRLDLKLWGRVFRHALPYRRLLIPLAISAVVIALCDASFALVTRWSVDSVVGKTEVNLWPPIAVYTGLTFMLAIGVWTFINSAGGLSNNMSHDIREECFKRLQELEFAYFDHRPTGWLISRLTSDCDKLARIIAWGSLDLLWAVCLVVVIAVILIVLHPVLGLLVLSVVPPLVVISAIFQKKLLLSSRETRKYNSMITAAFAEALQGLRTSKSLVREKQNLQEFQGLSSQMYGVSIQNAMQSAVYIPIVLTLGSIAAGIALWRGGVDVRSGGMSVGTLVAFIFYAGQFFNPINQIAQVLVNMQGAQAAGERVLSLLATTPGISDSDAVKARLTEWNRPGRPAELAIDGYPDKIEAIDFDHVDFAYTTGEPVLSGFNLTVSSGQTIALVGASGGGKSTIVNLAARFYEPTGGRILVNGQDLRDRSLDWYQSNLGIVLQGPHLFSGTIRENIRYGRLEATDEEVEAAARSVNADGFIRAMENGYETDVGEGGNRLSTGQKQLVSFARALLANPRIFIMDEATSSIDTETEQLIQNGLKAIFHGRISFVVAHRLSTIRTADRILVIEKGRILESGNHDDLMVAKGHYYLLYTRQFEAENEASLIDTLANG
ncbi:ABC transporter ATP-binding protein [Luteolibacter pohnpeiensis]|uniref:ABC transporter ATP-binding protein n=1 Tax=Luteolibacter pohnpeiensis TaxID=454153 RepID=A0A934S2M0_9BACT|nr:ABC transporter ATP-binding protein [Luteolibacter pohnpeiensis]MBK1882040.1 ABC transporter ATP-binding protein [Luteolibacter pohnpeiensis]